VLGAKAGRNRYEQIAATYRAVTENPATKAVLDAGRRKVPTGCHRTRVGDVTPIDAETPVLHPRDPVQPPQNGRSRRPSRCRCWCSRSCPAGSDRCICGAAQAGTRGPEGDAVALE
jgi:hypothetical protein